MNGRREGWMYEWTNEWMDGQTAPYGNEQDKHLRKCMGGCTDGQMGV